MMRLCSATLAAYRRYAGLALLMSSALVPVATTVAAVSDPVQPLAESFAALALQLGRIPGHEREVDSWFGPRPAVPAPAPRDAAALAADAQALLARIKREQARAPTGRGARLLVQSGSFAALADDLAQPHKQTFAQEAAAVYATTVPAVDRGAMRRDLQQLSALLPGEGDVNSRLEDYREKFVVPPRRRRAVFERALRACRERTLAHWKLPAGEKVDVEWDDSVPAAWHSYQGHAHSTLRINPAAVALVGQALDVACHEAYPGHHSQFLLLEQHAGPAGPAVEDSVALLHSPAQVLREGAANFGVDLAFPLAERIAFDRQVLFPLAGLDPARAQRYEKINVLVNDLAVAAVPIIAAYRDGHLSFNDAAIALQTDALIESAPALLQFVDQEGALTLGYTAARDMVRDHVRAQVACTGQDPWAVLAEMVAEPAVGVLSAAVMPCGPHAGRTN
jgi:hypothetical protein